MDNLLEKLNKIEIVNNFNIIDQSKPICILGVLKTVFGIQIEKDMLSWLSTKYNVISVRQDAPGDLFEYPAIKYALDFSKQNNCNVLYLHTKGAANPNNSDQIHVRNMWKDEFINHYNLYMDLLNQYKDQAASITPFTGPFGVTWYNAFFINSKLANMYELQFYENRYFYERLFFKNEQIKVIGRVMNDVDNTYHQDGHIDLWNASKNRMNNYIYKF